MSEKRSPLVPALLGFALLANAAGAFYLAQRYDGFRERLGAVETAIQQYRFERTSEYGGIGFNALLDHLTRWAPQLQKGGNELEREATLDRVEEIVAAMANLEGAAPLIAKVIREGSAAADDPASQDELRKWLLRAAYGSDRKLGLQLYEEVLRNQSPTTGFSSRLRLIAARNLLELDKERCGQTLFELVRADASDAIAKGRGSLRKGQDRKNFFNFIDVFVATDHAKVDAELMRLLNHSNIELITLQRCVEALGERGYRPAAARIKQLYAQEQPVPGQIPSPIFRRKCVEAVDRILGAEAKDFFAQVNQRESDEAIQSLLNKLKLKYGGFN